MRSDDFTFLLTAGGHNAGIFCGPVHPKRHHRIKTRRLADPHLAPEAWEEAAERHPGAWWPAWQAWLAAHSSGRGKPPPMEAAKKGYAVLEAAPGQYVRQRCMGVPGGSSGSEGRVPHREDHGGQGHRLVQRCPAQRAGYTVAPQRLCAGDDAGSTMPNPVGAAV